MFISKTYYTRESLITGLKKYNYEKSSYYNKINI